MGVPLPKNAAPLFPLFVGDGDMDGDEAEDGDGFWVLPLPGGVTCAIPGQKDGFQGVE